MTWAPLLLADPSPCLRLLVLRHLLKQEDNEEIKELEALREKDSLVAGPLRLQAADGSWGQEAVPGHAPAGKIQITAQVLTRLGYLGLGPGHPAVRRGAAYLFRHQRQDGSWPLFQDSIAEEKKDGYDMIPLQTSLPLRGLAACGFAEDPGSEKAYEWLKAQRLEDGAWPTGIAQGNYGGVAGYRRLAHSRWGCRSNTLGALTCFALHPQRRHSAGSQRALDLLLGCQIKERHHLGFETARLIGAEPSQGFITFYARFDIAQVLGLCQRIGASVEDRRVATLVEFVKQLQGPYGLWEYLPKPQASRWVSYDLLYSLTGLSSESDWLSLEPQTPFKTYPKKQKRF